VTALHRTAGAWLLHAIASEIDNRGATLVPDARVCRACGGRGETIVALDQGRFIDPAWTMDCIRRGWGRAILYSDNRPRPARAVVPGSVVFQTAMVVLPCKCETVPSIIASMTIGAATLRHNGRIDLTEDVSVEAISRTRRDTVSLAWLVAYLADQRTPAFEWPAQWLVDMDLREDNGDRSWQAVWWAQFYAWTRGVALDEERLRWAREVSRAHRYDFGQRDELPRVAGLTGCGRITMISDNVAVVALEVHDHWVYAMEADGVPVSFETSQGALLADVREGLTFAIGRRLPQCNAYRTPDGFTLTLPEARPGQVPDLARATSFDLASRMMLASTPTGEHWPNPWMLGHQPGGLGSTTDEREAWYRTVEEQRRALSFGRGSRDDIVAAIRSADPGVTDVRIYENPSEHPYTVEVVVEGGDEVVIAEALHDASSVAIAYIGTTSVTISTPHTFDGLADVQFSRPDARMQWGATECQRPARMVAAPVPYTWDEITSARPGHDLVAERMRAADAAIQARLDPGPTRYERVRGADGRAAFRVVPDDP
jgi:hypothetical protein